jgi:hypothetical protein
LAAQIISLASQQTVDNLQFSLVATPAYEVSGVVVDEAGSPFAGTVQEPATAASLRSRVAFTSAVLRLPQWAALPVGQAFRPQSAM